MGPNLFDNFEEEPQIDLTPLIDCLFMLIIFFVLTMSFSRPVLEIILPEAKNAEEHAERNELVLSVKADGSLWLGDEKPISRDLPQHLTRILRIFSTSLWTRRHRLQVSCRFWILRRSSAPGAL